MDKKSLGELRRRNFGALVSATTLNKAEIARRLGKHPSLISNYLNPKKPKFMGEDFAREIENTFGLVTGWLDHPSPQPWTAAAIPNEGVIEGNRLRIRNEPADFPVKGGAIAVDQLDVRASMGPGIGMPERETVIDQIRVPLDYVRENFPTVSSPANLKIITGFGDSMRPTFQHNDPLIVDTGVKTMDIDTVYVFAFQEELYIKRIQRLPDRSIKVISDNRAMFDPIVLDAKQREQVTVIGRVICAVNMNKIS